MVVSLGFPVAQAEVIPGADFQSAPVQKLIDDILRQPENTMDLGRIKLTIVAADRKLTV
jgi:hypothetical protein